METLRCVTLDLDDTLWDHRRAQAEVLRSIAAEQVPAAAVDTFVERFHYHNRILWAQYGRGEVAATEVKGERFARTMVDLGLPAARAREIGDDFLWRYGSMPYLRPGARQLLDDLNGRMSIGCITDGFTEVQYRKMETTGIERHFDFVLTSEEVGVTKPDPAIYAAAVAAAGCSAGEIVHVGDSFEKDIVGALSFGMRAAWLPHPDLARKVDAGPSPDWVLSDLLELPRALGLQ